MKTDLVKIINKVVANKLNEITIKWKNYKSMTIVLCSKGYPGKYKKNKIINNLNKIKLAKNEFIFHAGTKFVGNNLFSIGGRVLNITSIGNNFFKIRKNIISIIKKIKWNNGFYRKDIGWKIINKNANN